MKNPDYDLVIIGGGPAGLTAGIYAARARLKVVLIEHVVTGGQTLISDWIENYPGFPDGISGAELAGKMSAQAAKFDLKIENSEVKSLKISDDIKSIKFSDKTITAYSVIIASGASPKKLGIPGENAFFGKGISTCATCDGPFFKENIVAAVGGGDTAVQESLYLTKFAKKVYLIHRRDELRATGILQERAFANKKLEIIWDSIVTDIKGLTGVETISIENVKTKEKEEFSVDGVFIWVGIIPNTKFLNELIELDESGFIKTDYKMETSAPGVFGIGDVRATPLRQIATAVGDGAIAAFSAEQYIEAIKK